MKREYLELLNMRDVEPEKPKEKKRKHSTINDWYNKVDELTEEEKMQKEEEWREKEMKEANINSEITSLYDFDFDAFVKVWYLFLFVT